MASVRELILQAAVAALNGAGKPAGLAVHRNRTRPFGSDQLPAIVLYPGPDPEDVVLATHDGGVERRFTVRAECRAIAAGVPPDQATDPLTTWCTRALHEDPTFGGLAAEIEERRISWAAEETDQVFAAAAVDFLVTYYTHADDPEAQ